MGIRLDISNQRFGKLIAIESVGVNTYGTYLWKCQCDCGNFVIVKIASLREGSTASCGCVSKGKLLSLNTTHGDCGSPEYLSWSAMKGRCYRKSSTGYENYGGRGIRVCDRWLGRYGYENFLRDMGRKPTAKHSLDRINVDGNYEPNNCRWATFKEQAGNTRRCRHITYNGETRLLTEWAIYYGVHYMVMLHHLKRKSMQEIDLFYKNKKPGKSYIGLKCISFDNKKRLYRVKIMRNGIKYSRRFKDKPEAIKYRNELFKQLKS